MAGGKGSKGKKRPGAKRQGTTQKGQAVAPAGGPGGSGATRAAPVQGAAAAKQSRTERLEAARRARRRKAMRVRVGVATAVFVLIAGVAAKVLADRRAEEERRERLTAGSCTFDTRSDSISQPPNNHVAPERYEVDPPAGGNHSIEAAQAGFYGDTEEPPPADPELVHSLEHGYVVLWHRPGLEEKDMSAIRTVYDRYSSDVLVVPRASLKVKVAATAWGERLLCPQVEPASLTEFVKIYRNKGPEPVEHP